MFGYVVTALVAAFLACSGTWKVQDWRYASKEAERLEAARESARMNARVADVASEKFEVAREKIRTEFLVVTSEVEKIVEKPIYRNVCLDDDGLRALSAALGNKPARGEPAPALPGPAAAR